MKKILVFRFHQESNTFNPVVTDRAQFAQPTFSEVMTTRNAVSGGADAIREAGGEAIPTIFLHAGSGGRVSDETFGFLLTQLEQAIRENTFDGIYASLHGATCTENCDDACGVLLEKLCTLAGNKPIAASFDLHANITEKLLENADIVCGYQTYPHRDFYETGYRAAKFLMELLAGKKPCMVTKTVPMLVPPAGYTSDEGAFGQLIAWGKELMAQKAILDFTIFPVQPWLDIPEIASRVVVIAQEASTAKLYANLLAQRLAGMGDEMQPNMLSVDEIIDIAEKNTTGMPVVLSESADSPNGGCVGDSPIVAMRLTERGSSLKAGLFVVDPAAVEKAFALGVGGTGEFSVGAGFTPGMPGPYVSEGKVLSLHDGKYTLEGPANRGGTGDMGKCAVVRFGRIDILLCNCCTQSGDPQVFRHFGIEPTLYDLIVVKANTSFRLPYSKFTDLIYAADTVGAGASDLKKLPFSHLPERLYPFSKK